MRRHSSPIANLCGAQVSVGKMLIFDFMTGSQVFLLAQLRSLGCTAQYLRLNPHGESIFEAWLSVAF